MELVLVRHGDTENAGEDGDAARQLTDIGWRVAEEVGRGLASIIDKPDGILTSPKVRAQQTAQQIAKPHGLTPQPWEVLAEGEAEDIRDALGRRRETRLLLVGHEPVFSQLVSLITSERIPTLGGVKMRKTGSAKLEVNVDDGQLTIPGELQWLLPPQITRRLA